MILPHQSGERGYIKRLNAFWKEKGLFEGEQRLCNQDRIIKVGWLVVRNAIRGDKETCGPSIDQH